jgi:transcription antitermination factor NusG
MKPGIGVVSTWRYPGVSLSCVTSRPYMASKESRGSQSKSLNESWCAVYTMPRHEKFVHARLMAKRIHSFLPFYTAVRRWKNGVRREIKHPLWPGYLFVCIGTDERIPVLHTPGVRHIVGDGSSPLALDDHEIHALRICGQCESLLPHPFLCPTNTICITHGPFQGLKGYLEKDGCDLMFAVNIHLIQKSFAIRVQNNGLEFA